MAADWASNNNQYAMGWGGRNQIPLNYTLLNIMVTEFKITPHKERLRKKLILKIDSW